MSVPSVKVRRFSRNKFEPDTEQEVPAVVAEQEQQEAPAVIEEEAAPAALEEEDFLAELKGDTFEEPLPEPAPKKGRKKKEQLPPLPVFAEDQQPPPVLEPDPFNPHQYDHVIEGIMRDSGPPPLPLPKPVLQRSSRKGGAAASGGGFSDLFGAQASPILGADRRELLAKIREYKVLFSDVSEVKAFKIKESASVEQLEAAVQELDVIVSSSTVQTMCDEMILSSIRMVEAVSTRTPKFDITGTADLLKQNPEFSRLCKQLTIRYRVFSRLPPEYQLLLMVTSTAMIARQANMRRHEIEGMLNHSL